MEDGKVLHRFIVIEINRRYRRLYVCHEIWRRLAECCDGQWKMDQWSKLFVIR